MFNRISLSARRFALLIPCGLLLAGTACQKEENAEPESPANTIRTNIRLTASDQATTKAVQAWFRQVSEKCADRLDWPHALAEGSWLVVPFVDKKNPFSSGHKQGYRYLIVQEKAQGAYAGQIVEIVIDGLSNTPEQASRFALQAVQQQHTALPSIPGFTGWLLVYSSTYMHQASLVYQNGTLQPGSVQIQTIRPLQATAARSQSAFITESEPAPATNLRDGETTCIRVTICGTVNGTPAGCETTTYCVEGGDDGSGGSGGGGGGEGGWGGPAGPGGPSSSVPTSESIDPSVVLTPAVNPPDVLEYNCDQLRNTHSDDQYQSAPTTLANFIQANSGKSRSQIIAQRGFQLWLMG